MAELWSAVVLVGRGQLGLRQVDTLRRDPLHEGPDKGFPFFDMDLQRHQALDFLAPKRDSEFDNHWICLGDVLLEKPPVLLDYVQMRGGGLAQIFVTFSRGAFLVNKGAYFFQNANNLNLCIYSIIYSTHSILSPKLSFKF